MGDARHRIREASTRTLVVAMLFGAALLTVWVPIFVRDVSKQAASSDWPTATATVIQSETYRRKLVSTGLRFRYRFAVDGKEHETGERRAMGLSMFYTFDSDRQFVEKHPVASALTIYYDPGNPKRVTLSQGLSALDFLFAGPFIPAFALMVFRTGAEILRRFRTP